MNLPRSIDEVSTDWLSAQLSSGIEAFSVESLGGGYMSDVYRLRFDDRSLVVKFSSTSTERRELARRFRSHEKEHAFYRVLAPRLDVRTPHCFFNYLDEQGHFVLGLEDLASGTLPIEVGFEVAREAVISLARLHGSHWGSAPAMAPTLFPAFEAAAEDLQSSGTETLFASQLISAYARNSMDYLPIFLAQPQVLSHMDFRPNNLARTDSELIVFDWGEFCMAPPGFDLAYFMVTGISADNRSCWEHQLLQTYLETLQASGIHDYDFNNLFASYQLCLLPAIYMPLLMLSAGNTSDAQLLADRISGAVEEHADSIRHQIASSLRQLA